MAIPFLSFLAVLSLAATIADGATPAPCTSSQLAFNLTRVPFNTSALLCSSVWEAKEFVLLFKQEDSKTWNFVLSAPRNKTYIAIGFSPSGGMVGSSAVVGWLPDGAAGKAKQYYLGGRSPTEVVADTGNLTLALGKTTIFSERSRVYLTFQLTDTEKPIDKLIYAVGPTPTDNVLNYHSAKITTTIVYASEQGAPSPTSGTGSPTAPAPSNTAGMLALSSIPAISTVLAMLLL